ALIEEFGRVTGVPVVLNTSFNNDNEPIVDSIDDAVTCFLTTDIQYLVIGDWLAYKPASIREHPGLVDLVPTIPKSYKLVRPVESTVLRATFSPDPRPVVDYPRRVPCLATSPSFWRSESMVSPYATPTRACNRVWIL